MTGLPPLFDGMSPDLTGAITPSLRRIYQQGDVLCREGEAADHLFVILSGTVDVAARDESLVQRGAGAVVGEQAFVEEQSRGATITAIGQVEALRLPRVVVDLLLGDRAFVRSLLRVISAKLSEATAQRAVRFRRERLLFEEFGAHVSSEVAQRLVATGRDYGQPREVEAVILFSDIRGFTPTSATIVPRDLAAQLTTYFDRVVDVIHAYGGVVDKFIGDAVMAFWGGFESLPTHDAARLAFDCSREITRVAAAARLGGAPIRIGVGLNVGRVFMGNVGGAGKRQFTVLGSAVNLAARYEAQAKDLGVSVVMSAELVEALASDDRAALKRHESVPIKGAEPQTLFTWSFEGSGLTEVPQ